MRLGIVKLISLAAKSVLNVNKKEKLQLINYDIIGNYNLNWLGFAKCGGTCCCALLFYVYSSTERLCT